MKIDHGLAREQLDYLKGLLTFQTFHDVKVDGVKKNQKLTRVIHGSYESVQLELERLNKEGAGIYITVNETDGNGRTAQNVIRIRAVVTDHDNVLPPPFPLAPTFTVLSKNGPQHWWIVDGLSTVEFVGVQRHLIENYSSDPRVCDPPRVLRLAGFWHLKDPNKPFQIQFENGSGCIYSRADILTAFPPVLDVLPAIRATRVDGQNSPLNRENNFAQRPLSQLTPIFSSCDAFKRIKEKILGGGVLSHDEGFALFHLCLQFRGGSDWFISRVPGWGNDPSDLKQLQQSIDKKYGPWSCVTLQSRGVCRFKEKCHCMPISKRGGFTSQPNPIRFSRGLRSDPPSTNLEEILGLINEGDKK